MAPKKFFLKQATHDAEGRRRYRRARESFLLLDRRKVVLKKRKRKQPVDQSVSDARDLLIGCIFSKAFPMTDGGVETFEGIVMSYDAFEDLYLCRYYADGDCEFMLPKVVSNLCSIRGRVPGV